jgi:Prohead core protein serine protease
MLITKKLIVESPNYDIETIVEQKNTDAEKVWKFTGQYIMVDRKNRNNRIYESSEMIPAIDRYIAEYINNNRGGGECNHSLEPEMKLDRLAHKITKLYRDPSDEHFFIGESTIIGDNPPGRILIGLCKSAVNWGLSSKCLGTISESVDGNKVKQPIILGVDAVWDASANTKFVNGIYEDKEWIIGEDNKAYEAFAQLEKHLAKYPSHHRDAINRHILEGFQRLLQAI